MGFTPSQVDAMSLWTFRAALGGWAKANGAEGEDFTREDMDALGSLMDRAVARSAHG